MKSVSYITYRITCHMTHVSLCFKFSWYQIEEVRLPIVLDVVTGRPWAKNLYQNRALITIVDETNFFDERSFGKCHFQVKVKYEIILLQEVKILTITTSWCRSLRETTITIIKINILKDRHLLGLSLFESFFFFISFIESNIDWYSSSSLLQFK